MVCGFLIHLAIILVFSGRTGNIYFGRFKIYAQSVRVGSPRKRARNCFGLLKLGFYVTLNIFEIATYIVCCPK